MLAERQYQQSSLFRRNTSYLRLYLRRVNIESPPPGEVTIGKYTCNTPASTLCAAIGMVAILGADCFFVPVFVVRFLILLLAEH